MKIQFIAREAGRDPQLHQIFGYAEGDAFGGMDGDRFVLMLDGADAHHVTFPSYVEQIAEEGPHALTSPSARMTDHLLSPVWRVPTGKGDGACIVLTRFDDAASGTPGQASWSLCGVGFGPALAAHNDRLSRMDLDLPRVGAGRVTVSSPGPDVSNITRGLSLAQLGDEPLWGFGAERMTIAPTYSRAFLKTYDEMRRLDIRQMFEDGLTPDETERLDAFRSDFSTGFMLPSHNARTDPVYADFLRGMHERGLAFSRFSVTESEREAHAADAARIIRDIVLGGGGPGL